MDKIDVSKYLAARSQKGPNSRRALALQTALEKLNAIVETQWANGRKTFIDAHGVERPIRKYSPAELGRKTAHLPADALEYLNSACALSDNFSKCYLGRIKTYTHHEPTGDRPEDKPNC